MVRKRKPDPISHDSPTPSRKDSFTPINSPANVPEEKRGRIRRFIGSITHAPHWIVDNHFIKEGYRINYKSNSAILKSLFRVHNELVNIWTHLIGAIFVIGLVFYLAITLGPSSNMSLRDHVKSDVKAIWNPVMEKLSDLE